MTTERYLGKRGDGSATVLRIDAVGRSSPLPMRHDLRNHSPTGPEWGYGGSGPAQLALAILCDALGEHAGLCHYQDFKFAVIACLAHDEWEMSRADVLAWYDGRKRQRPETDAVPSPSQIAAVGGTCQVESDHMSEMNGSRGR